MGFYNKAQKILSSRRWTLHFQLQFFIRVSHFLQGGMSIHQALQVVAPGFPTLLHKDILFIDERIREGDKLEHIFKELSFHEDIISLLALQRESTKIQELISRCRILLDQKVQYRKFIRTVLQYPIFLTVLTLLSGMFMSYTLYPQYESYFMNAQTKLPRWLIMSKYFLSNLPILLVITLIFIGILYIIPKYFLSEEASNQALYMCLKIPIVNKMLRKVNTFSLAQHMLVCLSAGLSFLDSLEAILRTSNKFLRFEARKLHKGLREGNALSKIFSEDQMLDNQFTVMIHQGKIHGDLVMEFQAYCQIATEDLQLLFKRMVVVSQLVMYGFMFVYIILLYSMIMLPMYQMFTSF